MFIRDAQLNGNGLDGWFGHDGKTFRFTYQPYSPFLTVFETQGYDPAQGQNWNPVLRPYEGLSPGVRRDVIRTAEMHLAVLRTSLMRRAENRRAG